MKTIAYLDSLKSKYILIFVFVLTVMIFRRPDIITSAQPWAEDGHFWLAMMYNDGIKSLFSPENGYFQTISRLSMMIGLVFGLNKAILVSNIIAISLRSILVCFFLSSRFKSINIHYRVAVSLFYLLMPNLTEGYINITNIHWYLSIYLLLVVLSETLDKKWKIHDCFVVLLAGLSGPFIIFIAPCYLIVRINQYDKEKTIDQNINVVDYLFILVLIIQLISILTTIGASRSSAPLGVDFALLTKILSSRIFYGAFFDFQKISYINNYGFINVSICMISVLCVMIFFFKSTYKGKILVIYPSLVTFFSLLKPMMSLTEPQWPLFLLGCGERYFFIPSLFWGAFVLWGISFLLKNKIYIYIVLLLFSPIFLSYFHMQPLIDVGYNKELFNFYKNDSVVEADIPINPVGWTMHLIKTK